MDNYEKTQKNTDPVSMKFNTDVVDKISSNVIRKGKLFYVIDYSYLNQSFLYIFIKYLILIYILV